MKFQKIFAFFAFLSLFVDLGFADSPQPNILLVLDAHCDPYDPVGCENKTWGYYNVAPYYIQALNALGLQYKNCTIVNPGDDGPGYDQDGGCNETTKPHLKDFDIVIWFTGNDGRTGSVITLRDDDRDALKQFLDNGGKLFLTGQDIGFECRNLWSPTCNDNSFYANYLHAYWCLDNASDNTLWGENSKSYPLKNTPIGAGFKKGLNEIDIKGGASNQVYPSTIFYREGDYVYWIKGVEFVYGYTTGGIKCDDGKRIDFVGVVDPYVGAIRADTGGPLGYKVVYFAFGFEGITGEGNRTEIMKRVIGYLRAPDTLGTKIYAEASQIEGVDYIDTSLTCDPTDTFCHRGLPKVNATCRDYQLFANVSGAEYYIDTPVIPERFAGNGTSLQAVDGSFNDNDVDEVVYGTVALQGIQSKYTFGTHNLYVHCNDTDGYWGKYDNYAFYVDRYYPLDVKLTIESGKRYTNKTKPLMEITYSDAKEDIYPHYMRFSCNTSVGWTPWIYISGSIGAKYPYTFTYSGFDITNTSVGCPAEDGNRTVCVQIRDQAGNWDDKESVNCSWIVLDRIAPQISSIIPNPEINSWLKSIDNITIVFYDPILPDGVAGSGVHINYTGNGTTTQPLFNNTPFNPGWVNEGLNILDVWINDTVGNLNYTRYIFRVDNTPPLITIIRPENISYNYNLSLPLNFTATDSLAGVDKCWYSIDNGPNITLANCANSTFNTTEGFHILAVYANDSLATVGNENFTKIAFTVDLTLPTISLVSPANNSWVNTQTPSFTFNSTDNLSSQLTCTLYIDGISNGTLTLANNTQASIISTTLAEGQHTWWVNCSDKAGNEAKNEVRTINIDITAPSISLISPAPYSWLNTQTPTFSFVAVDNLASELNCTLYIDGISNGTLTVANNTQASITSSTLSEGSHAWWVNCSDKAGNEAKNEVRTINIDITAPSISLISPAPYSWLNTQTPTFSFVAVDNLASELNCTLYIDGISNGTLTVANNTQASITSSTLSEGSHAWWVNCSDKAGNEAKNEVRTINIDITAPSISLVSPAPYSWLNTRTPTFSFVAVDNLASELNCTLYIDGISNGTLTVANNTQASITSSTLSEGSHTWFIKCIDNATNSNVSATRTVGIDVTPPLVSSISPSNDTWTTDQTPDFTISSIDNLATSLNCTFYVDGSSIYNGLITNGTTFTLASPVTLPEGKRVWWVNCTDYASNEGMSEKRTINIDISPPLTTDNTTGQWYSKNQTVLLTCTDYPLANPVGCNLTLYCVYSKSEIPCDPSLLPTPITQLGKPQVNYTTAEIGCGDNSVCEYYVRYRSNDTLGNLETNKTSNLVRIDKAKPVTTIIPNGSDWTRFDVSFTLNCSDLGSGCLATYYNITDETSACPTSLANYIQGTSGIVTCPANSTCRKKVCFYSVDNVSNAEAIKESAAFKIDKEPPAVWNYRINATPDVYYGDLRLYPLDSLEFSVNASDLRNVSKVIVTIINPIGEAKNYSLTPITPNFTNDTWRFTYDKTSLLGTYLITKLYANDTLGNFFVNDSVNISFLVVNGSVKVALGETNEIDAGTNKKFNLTFNFNKTFEAPKISVYIPPNSPANTSQPPNYINQTPYTCYFGATGCALAYGFDNQPYITWMNATGIGNNTSLSILAEKMKAATPVKDTNDWWISRFRGIDFSNLTKIKTPFLNITRILCDGNTTCVVYQNKAFNLTVEIQNAFIANEHTGNAYNVSASYESSIGSNTSFVNYTLASGSLQNVTWVLNITEAGNYTFTLKAWEFTKQYNATPRSVLIQVKDTVPPKIISSEWGADNIFNINETIDYYVTALDNVAIDKLWIVINQSNGNVENHTLTLYLGSPSYGKWKSTYANTSLVGSYSILGIYANDTEGNVGSLIPTGNLAWFEVRRLLINTTVAIQNLTIGSVQTIFANITGNASSITSITATIAKPRSYVETVDLALVNTSSDTYSIFIATGDYTNATRSGYYELNTTVKLASGINATASTSFSVFYGNVSIKADRDLIYLPVTLGRYNLTFYIIPDKGDLIGVNGSLFIDNTTVINLTSTLPQNQSFGDIYWEEWKSYPVKWEINTSNLGSTLVTLHVNSTTPSVPLDEQNKTKTTNITIIPNDTLAPIIIDFGHELDKINLFEPNKIWINATDNETMIGKVLVEINYTTGNKENLTASEVLPEYYELTFSNANVSGVYSYRIIAVDVAGNEANSSWKSFIAYDNYSVEVFPEFTSYNKGEIVKITTEVKNVNGLRVRDFNLTLKVYNTKTNVTVVENQITDSGTFEIKSEYPPVFDPTVYVPPVTYTIYAEVNKNNNKGSGTNTFSVSTYLDVVWINLRKGMYIGEPGTPLNISIVIKNARNENTSDPKIVIAFCTYKLPTGEIVSCPGIRSGLYWDEATKTYNSYGKLKAPNSTTFDISIEIYHVGNRDMFGPEPYLTLTTQIPTAAPLPAPPVVPPPPACECTDWEKIGCGLGGCKETEMFMMRSCKPAGCAPEKQCLELPECIIGDFEFNLQESIEIPQGEDRKASGSLKNVGIVPLIVQLSIVEAENVSASLSTSTIDLPLKAEKPFDVLIHVPLTLEKDKEYSVKIAATSGNVTKLKSIKVKVTENPYIPKLSNLAKELEKLRVEIEEYERVGVDVKELKKLIESAKEKVEAGNRAIDEDNLSLLRKSVSEIEGIIGDVKIRLTALWLRKFLYENKWNIIILAIVLILSNYFVTQVALPYYKLGKEIKKLVEEEKSLVASRVEIEKQYFLRKIDEKTFFTLMADKQGKILRTRADITRKREERKKLLIAKLHPGAIAVWFKSNAIEFAIYLKNLPKKVYEKIKVKKIKVEKPKVPEVEVPKLPKAKILRELRYQVWKFKHKIPRIKLPSIKLPKVKVPKKVSREIKYRIWKIKRKIFRKIK